MEVIKMPRIEDASQEEIRKLRRRIRKREEIMEEYKGYIKLLTSPDVIKKLIPNEGEKVATLKNRLRRAAKALGKEIELKKSGNAIFFWLKQ